MEGRDVVVLGGGISGLSLAYGCASAGLDVLVLEKSAQPGGCIQSARFEGGFWLELGAHTCYSSYGRVIELIEACGLREALQDRLRVPFRLLREGELRSIPGELSFWELLRSLPRMLSASKQGQTVESYYSRLVGPGNYARVLSPMLSAVPSQNADAFPATMLFKKRPRRKDVSRTFTIDAGLQTLIDALAERPGVALRTGAEVTSIEPSGESFGVAASDGSRLEARWLALALPPSEAARLLGPVHPELAAALGRIATVTLESVGVVVAKQKLELPAVAGIVPVDDLFHSVVTRDPVPHPELRGFAFHFRPGTSENERLERIAALLGVERSDFEARVESRVVLPSPVLGHEQVVAEIDRLIAGTRLLVTGNYFAGLALEDCVGRSLEECARLSRAD
jgi:protoporphyrinogen oxidase